MYSSCDTGIEHIHTGVDALIGIDGPTGIEHIHTGIDALIGIDGPTGIEHIHTGIDAPTGIDALTGIDGHINLEEVGKRGYHIPHKGTLQVVGAPFLTQQITVIIMMTRKLITALSSCITASLSSVVICT